MSNNGLITDGNPTRLGWESTMFVETANDLSFHDALEAINDADLPTMKQSIDEMRATLIQQIFSTGNLNGVPVEYFQAIIGEKSPVYICWLINEHKEEPEFTIEAVQGIYEANYPQIAFDMINYSLNYLSRQIGFDIYGLFDDRFNTTYPKDFQKLSFWTEAGTFDKILERIYQTERYCKLDEDQIKILNDCILHLKLFTSFLALSSKDNDPILIELRRKYNHPEVQKRMNGVY